MTTVSNALSPYAKALVCAAAIALAVIADNNGVDLGLDIESLWGQILAVLIPTSVVYAVPNRARRGPG